MRGAGQTRKDAFGGPRVDYSRALERKPKVVLSAELAEAVDGRLIGIATHLVISQLDPRLRGDKFTPAKAGEAIEKTKEKLLADEAITEAVAGHIDTKSIMTFFESELGQTVLDSNNTVEREWPFTFALPASEFSNSGHEPRVTSDELIIVQGIIDMLVQTPKGLLVIDFKTDNITAKDVCERGELYRHQLELYSKAAGAILKTKIVGKWLYFLTPGCEFKVQ